MITQRAKIMLIMIKAIDFFCGAGGLTRGLLNAGTLLLRALETLREMSDKTSGD
jgi:site-specific DNA-cytosine methylase